MLLLFAVLAPAVCLLWFMGAAMRNERLATRQKLAEVYRGQLSVSQLRLRQYWQETAAELEKFTALNPASAIFAQCVQSGIVDGAVIFDEQGRVGYPNTPSAVASDFGELESKWAEASRSEYSRKYLEAARRYGALAETATNANAAARAFQSKARCLVQAGQNDAVIQLVDEVLSAGRYRHAADWQGRLIVANAELLALELMTNRSSPAFQSIARRLAGRLMDYENPALAAPQRRFLMKEVQGLSPEKIEFPTLTAELLAASIPIQELEHPLTPSLSPAPSGGEGARRAGEGLAISNQQSTISNQQSGQHPLTPSLSPAPSGGEGARKPILQRAALPDLWQFITPNHRVLALIRSDKLLAASKAAMAPGPSLPDVTVTLVPPDVDTADAFVTLPAGEQMPGWRLALSLKDRAFFDATAGRQTAVYLWTGILVMAGMGILTALAVRLVRRQMTLARLKNDLAATISHELKTPLSSMRVLLETLLDSEKFEENKTREYLRLIARENERLGRLIETFLTFSRMERRKYAFHFSLLPARQIIDAAVASVRGRFESAGCRLDVEIEDNLPLVMADAVTLATALSNLLENACKYSEETRTILLRARAGNGSVIFSVTDNGIGIAPGEWKRIFQPFYQVDQRLSRHGSGCGLGLSIVRFITTAHRGSVSVESQPGCGSTFAISLPVATDVARASKEAIA